MGTTELARLVARHPGHQGERNHRSAAAAFPKDLARNPDLHPTVWREPPLAHRGDGDVVEALLSRRLGTEQVRDALRTLPGSEALTVLAAHNQLTDEECRELGVAEGSTLHCALRSGATEKEEVPEVTTASQLGYLRTFATRGGYSEDVAQWPTEELVRWEIVDPLVRGLAVLGDDPDLWETALKLAPEWAGTVAELAETVAGL